MQRNGNPQAVDQFSSLARHLLTRYDVPTFLDEVWFLSNPSSGRTGYTIAEVFARAGHQVTLISGPTALNPPDGVALVSVISTVDLRDAVTQHAANADVIIMAAAPVDFRPAGRQPGKMKKTDDKMVVELVRNPDILKEIAQNKGGRILIGFALEATDLRSNALRKLKQKHLDLIVGNSPSAFGGDRTSVEILGPDGVVDILDDVSKEELAGRLLDLVESLSGGR